MRATLQNNLGQIKQVKVGFSWTYLFFTSFVPTIRGDIKWAAVSWGTWLLATILFYPTAGISLMIWNTAAFVFAFFYNKLYINDLLAKGFEPVDEANRNILVQGGFVIK